MGKGEQNGYWEGYYINGQLRVKCVYINGKINGFEKWYWSDATIGFKNYYL